MLFEGKSDVCSIFLRCAVKQKGGKNGLCPNLAQNIAQG
jgi:hypothetical protein